MKLRMPRPLTLALMTFVLVVATACLLFGLPIYRQQRALRAIEKCGGWIQDTRPFGPGWLRKLIGEQRLERFNWVTELSIYEGCSDADLAAISGMTSLEYLEVSDGGITEMGVENLRRLPNLRDLILYDNPITDIGMTHLRGLRKLQVLDIRKTKITDRGLHLLPELPRLRKLWLDETDVTDGGLKSLEKFPNLKFLSLRETRVTGAGMRYVRRLQDLEGIELSETAVGDNASEYLNALPQLKSLDLFGTKITDNGIERLRTLRNLEYLDLSHTGASNNSMPFLGQLQNLEFLSLIDNQVTDAGIEELVGPSPVEATERVPNLRKLKTLRLDGTKISDDSLPVLKRLESLEDLWLMSTHVSDTAVAELKSGMPRLQIHR